MLLLGLAAKRWPEAAPYSRAQHSNVSQHPIGMNQDMIDWHMASGTPQSRAMYSRFIEMLDAIGPYTVHPAKSTITFKGSRRGFCGAHPKGQMLVGYFDLMRDLGPDSRIRSISPYTTRLFVHQFRLAKLDEMDKTFQHWLVEAYGIGRGEHLLATRP
jgi:Domain of unknown function (DUF5655)